MRNADEHLHSPLPGPQSSMECLAATRRGARSTCGFRISGRGSPQGQGRWTVEALREHTALLPDHPAEGKIALTLEFKWQISMLCTVISQAGAVASKECSRAEIQECAVPA